jgi:cell division protein FtsB
MTTAKPKPEPETIFLQWYDEDGEHDPLSEITWCQNRINDNDPEYRLYRNTAHERYTAQVAAGEWHAYNDLTAENQRQQIAGLVAERDALMTVIAAKQAQVDALLAERKLLRAEIDELRTEHTDPFDLACLDTYPEEVAE